jgi:hypothetical protein
MRLKLQRLLLAPLALPLLWLGASALEWRTGLRLFPWSAYNGCGLSQAASLPATVRLGLYEEFPVPWRLDRLRQVNFPVSLAVAAASRAEFLKLQAGIQKTYPQVQALYFWPILAPAEGYYPGAWSSPAGVRRAAAAADGLPTLWDLEMPRGQLGLSYADWWQNRSFLRNWLRQRGAPVHIWRSNTSMGLDPAFLRLVSMHFDPNEFPQIWLHLNLYTTGEGWPDDELARVLRCGVERYGAHFIPAFGVLDDGQGPPEIFVPAATLQRELQLARAAGVSEVWLFGVNGLNADYLAAVKASLPLAPLVTQ